MKKIIFILTFFILSQSYSQTENLPELKDYTLTLFFWPDTNVVNQKEIWPNKKTKVEYVHLHDSILLRKEYFESGVLKLTAEVYQVFRTDSMQYDSNGQLVLRVYRGYSDILHGKYFEYWDANGVAAKTTGSYKNGHRCGEWTERQSDRNLIVATYNDQGQLDGPYFEYYFNGANHRANIKWKGQFSVVTYSFTYNDKWSNHVIQNVTATEIIRAGVWEHYNRAGELLETVTYKWEKK